MVTVCMIGGLGNQMFEYSCGRALSLRLGTELQLETSNVDADPKREYALGCFRGVTAPLVKEPRGRIIEHWGMDYKPEVFDGIDGDVTIRGYWQSPKWFADYEPQIRKDFTFNVVPTVIENGVSVHFRRGDYLTPETMAVIGMLDTEYYFKAANYIKYAYIEKTGYPDFFLFSDDKKWLREHWPSRDDQIIVDGFKDSEELEMMSRCKHHILANSSFSWWGAWLSDQPGITIAPKKWLVSIPTEDLCPPSWIQI